MIIINLIVYEWRKLLSSSFLKILLVILLFANALSCISYAEKDAYVPTEKQEYVDAIFALYEANPERFYTEYQLALEERDQVNTSFKGFAQTLYGNDEYPTYKNFEAALTVIEADAHYHQTLAEVLRQAEAMIPTYLLLGVPENDYRVRYQKKVVDIYSCLNETVVLGNSPVIGWEQYFTYHTEYYFVLIFLLAAGVTLALEDRRIGFYSISGTCRHGRRSTAVAKLAAAGMLSAVVAAMFATVSLLSVAVAVGLSSPLEAVQSVESMRLCHYAVSVGEAALIGFAFKILVAVLFIVLIFAVCILLKSMLLAYVAGVGILMLYAPFQSMAVVNVGQWKYLNLFSVYATDQLLGRYRGVNVFGYSAFLGMVFAIFALALVLGALAVVCSLYHGRGAALSRLSVSFSTVRQRWVQWLTARRQSKHRAKSLSLSVYELYKNRIFYLLLAVLILFKLFATQDYYDLYRDSSAERNYKSYLAEIGGEYTDEKYFYLIEEQAKHEAVIQQSGSVEDRYLAGEMSSSEYMRYQKKYSVSSGKLAGLRLLMPTAKHLRELSTTGVIGCFVYETGYTMHSARGVDWLLILFVALFCCRFYLVENETTLNGSAPLSMVYATPKGRVALLARKLLLCLATVTAAWVMFTCIDFYCLYSTLDLPDMSAPLVSMSRYQNAPAAFTILQYTALTELFDLLGVLLLSLLCFFAAWSIKRTVYTYTTVFALLLIPHFAARAGVDFASRLDLTMLQNTDSLFRYSLIQHRSAEWFVVFLSVVAALTVVIAVLCSVRIKKGGKA